MRDNSGAKYGSWIGVIVGIAIWQFVVRPEVADALNYEGGFSLSLLAFAALFAAPFGAVGGVLGAVAGKALANRSRIDRQR